MLARRLAWLLVCCFSTTVAIWPLPAEYSHGTGILWLDPHFGFECQHNLPPRGSSNHKPRNVLGTRSHSTEDGGGVCQDERLQLAVRRAKEDIISSAFVPWKFHPRRTNFEPEATGQHTAIRHIRLQLSNIDFSDNIEAYELTVAVDGDVSIRFNHPLGAVRALTTFTQLFYQHSSAGYYLTHAPIRARDSPTFSHRGLNLDISRNIVAPKDAIRTLDAMAFSKFNRLHLHASDAQSWPLEIPSLPELSSKGAYHPSQVWSVSDLHQVQSFGFARGIEVYIEIDMPGHTASIVESHPDLIQSYNRKPWDKYSAQPPPGQLKLGDEKVNTFISTLLGDLLTRSNSFSSLFHIGGDEIKADAYDLTAPEVKPGLQKLVDHAISIVKSSEMTPVVWEEVLLDYNLTLPEDTLVQAWRNSTPTDLETSSLAQVVSKGHKAIFGAYDHWYLDCGHGGWLDPDPTNNETTIKSPFLDYCGPYHNWRHVYSYNPLADVPVEKQHLVVGGEASMWTEQTDGINLDNRLWPRLAAAGEVLWRGNGTVSEDVTRRLAEMREWLVAKGVAVGPVQVTWCLMNPGNCNL